MKTQIRNSVRFIAMVAVLALASHTVLGDDLNPPPYRGDPLSVFSEWQLVPGSLILNQTQWNTVASSNPAETLSTVPVSTQILPDPAGSYDFQLPNWIDNQPIKFLRLQLTWENAPSGPVNVFSQAMDGINPILGNITFASVPVLSNTGAGWYQYFDLEFKPNPDFERLHVTPPPGGYLTQAVIDTVSTVPEPATMAILALGGLVLRGKRLAFSR
jgi:hypothetical protein